MKKFQALKQDFQVLKEAVLSQQSQQKNDHSSDIMSVFTALSGLQFNFIETSGVPSAISQVGDPVCVEFEQNL